MFLPPRLPTQLLRKALVPVVVVVLTSALSAVEAGAATARTAGQVPPNAAANLVADSPADTTPHARDGSMRAFAQIGDTVYAGGAFSAVKEAGSSTWLTRSHLIAYDVSTGAIKADFAPQVDNAVQALAVSPDGKLIVGGNFLTVNGVSRKNLVALDPATGATIDSWIGRSDGGVVRRTVVRGNQLYIGGAFHWVNGTPHSLLARLDAGTGAIDPTFQVDASVHRAVSELVWSMDVTADGRTLVATGDFSKVNGLDRHQVVMVDLSGAPTVADWNTDRFSPGCQDNRAFFYAKDVDFSDDGAYFTIVADGGSDPVGYCDAISRWETADRGPNVAATWINYTGEDSVTSVEVADGVVYAGGHFRWVNNPNGHNVAGPGAVDRYGIAALDAGNGMPLRWNPTRSPGAQLPADGTLWGPVVWELWRGPSGLHVGYDSDGLGSEYHGRMGYFPLAAGRTVPVADAPQGATGYLYLGPGNGRLTRTPFSAIGLGTSELIDQPVLASTVAAFAVSDKVYWAKDEPGAPAGSVLWVSTLGPNGVLSTPWQSSGYNSWFPVGSMTGAFYLNGRMYYTTEGRTTLSYRYLVHDGHVVGATEFTLPTTGVTWTDVRGMTWVDGKLVYGSVDGLLRTVPFDPTAANGSAVDGAAAVVVATPTQQVHWSSPTLFFATG